MFKAVIENCYCRKLNTSLICRLNITERCFEDIFIRIERLFVIKSLNFDIERGEYELCRCNKVSVVQGLLFLS